MFSHFVNPPISNAHSGTQMLNFKNHVSSDHFANAGVLAVGTHIHSSRCSEVSA